jgi:release factor glutamine methyltransferase
LATPALDAKLLVGHALGYSGLQLAIHERESVSTLFASSVTDLMNRRLSGESVARIIGHREFYGLEFQLSAATLEPRPDTELLVDLALDALPQGGRLLDLGTGSGCIPISILFNRGDARGTASDINPAALDMAAANATRHGVADRLDLRQGDWFGALAPDDAPFDLIVSNPPYIATAVVETLAGEVKDFDPRLALDGGEDGLGPYRIIARDAPGWLRPGGKLLVEIGYDQGDAVSAMLERAGFERISVHKDLAGLDRVVLAHHI